ncbi:MAG TPA: tetratricopeptide repeat protein [Pyrinomonadaceae bacterium]|jgi:tetratricopeptide (TPR) repeat protein
MGLRGWGKTKAAALSFCAFFFPIPYHAQTGEQSRALVHRPTPQPTFSAPPLSAETRRAMEERLKEARARFEKNPQDAEAIIWLGRRTAYLGRFDEAIDIYTEGIRLHPQNPKLYRHRGHRYITTRRFDLAVKDLERAARLVADKPDEIEPDGLPNARGIPTSTTNSNIFYHLGLAHYLRGDFRRALSAYRECLKFSTNPDMLSATLHWLYMTLRRLGRVSEAELVLRLMRDDAQIIENHEYHRLLFMYKGVLTPETLLKEASRRTNELSFPSTAYGVGNWYLYNKRRAEALPVFLKIMESQQQTSFGYIAAEADLKRLGIRDFPRHPLPTRVLH